MVIDIRTIPEGHSVLSQETDLGTLKNDLPLLCGTISCNAEVDRNGPAIYIHLRFHCTYELECSRCLEPFCFPIDGDMRVVVKEQEGKHSGDANEDYDYSYNNRDFIIDISPSIYEEIMIDFPLKPLCSENCRGFENNTNTRLSAQQKAADTMEIDPRWAVLKKLKKV
jgi:uncharacterized protein